MTPYIGEIRIFAGQYAPAGWLFCNGQALSISENEALYTLIGTTYGGDGQTTFNLPDMRSRVPIHASNSFQVGAVGGSETVTLQSNQTASHTHTLSASSSTGTSNTPAGSALAQSGTLSLYTTNPPGATMGQSSIGPSSSGSGSPHNNIQPYIAIYYIIATDGIFPTQN